MNRRISLIGIAVFILFFSCNKDDDDNNNTQDTETGIQAFPGAEGFGANATGGRGGDVVYVTNLNSNGKGSLNEALGYHAMDGNGMLKKRYILFKVSGIVSSGTYLWDHKTHIEYGDFTLAGQTSPGGIILGGFLVWKKYTDSYENGTLHVNNMIIQHIRSRPSGIENGLDDAIRLNGAQNVIIDHCSFEWASDECMQIGYNKNFTVQNCIFGETLGEHFDRGGILIKYSSSDLPNSRISFHHNTISRIGGRLPQVTPSSDEAGRGMEIEISNNLIWDPGSTKGIITASYITNFITESQKHEDWWCHLNFINNYSFTLDVAEKEDYWKRVGSIDLRHDNSKVYEAGNVMNIFDDADKVKVIEENCTILSERLDFPQITYHKSGELMDYMVQNAGAFPRDAMDKRLMGDIESRTIDQTPCNEKGADDGFKFGWSVMPIPELDSDDDGMPDWWEISNGLNPLEQDHTGKDLSLQYTGVDVYDNIEVYLNRLSQNLTKGTNLSEGVTASNGSLIESFSVSNEDNLQAGSKIEFKIVLKDANLEKLEISLDLLEAPFDWPSPASHDITSQISDGGNFVFQFDIPQERTSGDYSVMLHARSRKGTDEYKVVDFKL